MVRSLSRGRFEHRSAVLESPTTDTYRRGGHTPMDSTTLRSMKKTSYTPRGGGATTASRLDTYSTPPRSPLDAAPTRSLSVSRSRFSRESRESRESPHNAYEYEDHRNPVNEGRDHRIPVSEGRSYGAFGRSASTMREQRFADDEESHHSMGGNSATHARDVLSKMRAAGGRGGMDRGVGVVDRGGMDRDRGMYTEPKPPLRSLAHGNLGRSISALSAASPRRRLDLRHEQEEEMYMPHHSENHNDMNIVPASRYEVMGMKEELKKKDNEAQNLRHDMDEMTMKYEENMTDVRSKLVATFKEDMQEMKTEWEEAFQRLKDESETTQRAMEMELGDATRAKSDTESELSELKAEYRSQMEELKDGYRSQMEELKDEYRSQMEEEETRSKERMDELKRSKEEDLERLRSMYEEHLDSTKSSASDVEGELKEEIHVLLEENEKVKMCYENLETEMSRYKNELDELNSSYQQALSDNLRREKEATSYKEELDDVLDENDKHARRNTDLDHELSDTKEELERMTSQYQRSQAEKSRFEKEFNATSKERDEATSDYNDLLKKLDAIQEERTLESRYTEALVNQRDNMNAIIENGQAEIEELKGMNSKLSTVNGQYVSLGKEFHLSNSDTATLRDELVKAEQFASLAEEFHLGTNGEDASAAMREDLVKAEQYASLAKELHLPNSNASTMREEFFKTSSALNDELVKSEKMKERLETLGRERERYNATVKALKYDLKALHGCNVGAETSLQEHMRLLNEKWDNNESCLTQIDKLKSELEESIHLLEENAKEREQMMKEHHGMVESLQRDLQETQTALVKMEREKIAMGDRLADFDVLDAKQKRIQEELALKNDKLEDRLAFVDNEWQERESQCKSLDSDKRALNAEMDKVREKKNELEDALDKMEDVKKGLKKRLESAYFDLEETQRELTSMRNDHEDEMLTFEDELSKLSKLKGTINSQAEEIKKLKGMLNSIREEQAKDLEDVQGEVTESFKVELRLMEEKHADQERRNNDYLEQKHRDGNNYIEQKHRDDTEELRTKNKQLDKAMKEQKESLDQKTMTEIKRRGEFAKQKQELEILRSKERHLETHVNQLEEHISKVVADYETKLQSSNITTCSTTNNEEKALKKQVREMEKKLEVSSAAMKQIGKSSLLMEKENERLKYDKNELKLKLKKLVDCAEKFGPK